MSRLDDVLEQSQWDLFWIPDDTVVVDRPELLYLQHDSGRPYVNVVNRTRTAHLDQAIDEVLGVHGTYSRWLETPQCPPGLAHALQRRGYQLEATFDAYALSTDAEITAPDRLRVVEVYDRQTLLHAIEVGERGFEMPNKYTVDEATLRKDLDACTREGRRVVRVVVYDADDQPVSGGGLTLFPDLDFGLLWAGATVPEGRGQGAYRAALVGRLLAARAAGIGKVGLYGKRDTSGPIVAKLGFEKAGPMRYWRRTT